MDSPCIEHKGKPRPNGYVRVTYKQKSWYAHRLAWTQQRGPIPDGLDVCHKCDNRKCVNIEHLFLGTRLENMRDAVRKNRQAKGFRLPHTKLTESAKAEIVSMARRGVKYKAISEKFGIHRAHAGEIAIQQGVRRNGIGK